MQPIRRKSKRNFDGKEYSLIGLTRFRENHADFQHKSAKNLVKKLNENGWSARTVRWKNQSGVYVKKRPNYIREFPMARRPIIFNRKSYDSKPKGTQCAGCGSKSKSRCKCDLGKYSSPMIDYDSITPEIEVMQYVDEMSDDRNHGDEYLAAASIKVGTEIQEGILPKDMDKVKARIKMLRDQYLIQSREYEKKIKIYHGTDRKFNEFNDDFLIGSSAWFTTDRDLAMKGYSGARGKGIVVEREFEESELNLATPKDEDKYLRMQLDAMGYDGIKYPSDGKKRYFVNGADKDGKPILQLSWGSADDVYEIWNYDKLTKPKVGGSGR